MKRHTLLYYIAAVLLSCLASCSEDSSSLGGDQKGALPIGIACTYPMSSMQTRVSQENGFVSGDALGIFVVDYEKDGTPGIPALKGERAGNIRFVYDGTKWTANYQLYWKNGNTPADFYGYYPYDQSMQTVSDYMFSVSSKQDSDATSGALAGYEASDLLWAKTTKVMPTTETVSLQYKHLMAGITVQLVMGTGFEPAEWATLDKTVQIENTILGGTVDLTSGSMTVNEGSPANITPLSYNGTYRAVVFPQAVAARKALVSVTIEGRSYPLVRESIMTYLSGKMHNMTITVSKSAATGDYELALTANDIVAWIDDPALHDGLVRQYTIVTLSKAGTLKEEVDKVCDDYDKLSSLKIVGPMNSIDRQFIQDHLMNLRDVNMAKVVMEDGHLGGFKEHELLQHFIFPETGIHTIDYSAFRHCRLMGSLTIPEGVREIESWAFAGPFPLIFTNDPSNYSQSNLTGSLTLPSTLKKIGASAFAFNRFSGELRLPDGIEYIYDDNYGTFQGCQFEGSIYLPSSLKCIPRMGFPKMTGTIVIPPAITEVGGFGSIGCTQVEFHDGVTEIYGDAFIGSQLQGELVLPPNLRKIGGKAFAGTKISKIIFPDALRVMTNGNYDTEGTFADCVYLTGTVKLPKHVTRIPAGCFRNCTAITGLVIPEGVDIIDEIAFENCYSLNSIVCEGEEPPLLCANVFRNVPKDNFTVEVPKGCLEKYREAEGWKEFKRIAEYSNFVCRPMQANALNTAHTEQLILNADGPWQVSHKPDWITLSQNSGTGKSGLTLTFNQMYHGTGNRSDTIRFVMPNEGYETFCVVHQYDYEQEEDSYLTLQKATQGRGIDILFLGDGYDGEDISNGNYLNLVRKQMEYFFDLEPYKSHRNYFNVYVGFPLSQEKGVNTMNTYVNNHFGTLYGYDGTCTSNQLLTEAADVRSYAVEHTPVTQDGLGRSLIILVPNSDAYSGVTYYEWYGSPISICPPSSRPYPQDTRGVVQHEAGGHGFGYLGDEEIIYSLWAPSNVKFEIEKHQRSGWYANLSTTSGDHSVPWADFVLDTRYSDQVDVFEGGFGYMRGIFRPEQNSCMNYGIPYYNAPSRLSIMRRIFDYAGEHFSMEYFYEHDSNAWGSTGQTRSSESAFSGSSYAGSNQHRAPQIIDGRKMSNRIKEIRHQLKMKR